MLQSLGEKIVEAFTGNQLIHLLNCFFQISDVEHVQHLLSTLDEDIQKTLSQLMQTETVAEGSIISDEKLVEQWNGLWAEWGEVLEELGDEGGEYAARDYDWEAPYFESYAFAADLERVAERMLPLLDEIHQFGIESDDLFEKALRDIHRGLQLYPDWMGALDGDPCVLEVVTSRCVLSWEWLCAESPIAFIRSLRRIEESVRQVELDRGQFIDFLAALPEEVRKTLYDYLSENRNEPFWQSRLENVRSRWHKIYHAWRGDFDFEGYLEDCRRLLSTNWEYGIPVVEYLISKEDFTDADQTARQTVMSFLRPADGVEWMPESSLLIGRSEYRFNMGSPPGGIATVLRDWAVAAEKLGMKERVVSLKFQLATHEHAYDWDVVLAAYREIEQASFGKTAARLLWQWIDFVTRRYTGFSFYKNQQTGESWVVWLIEAVCDPTKNNVWFLDKIRLWLQTLAENSTDEIKAHYDLVALLTCDLNELYGIKRYSSKFIGEICQERSRYEEQQQTQSRRTWLERSHAEPLIDPVMEWWRKCAAHLVPDPSTASRSDYTVHARWLHLLREINPTDYQVVVAKWQAEHKRRTSLWKAIRARGLPC